MQMFPGTQNRHKGTLAKTALLRNHLLFLKNGPSAEIRGEFSDRIPRWILGGISLVDFFGYFPRIMLGRDFLKAF